MRRLQMTEDLYNMKTVLGTRVATRAPEGGQSIICNMSYIDKKIQEIVKEIIARRI